MVFHFKTFNTMSDALTYYRPKKFMFMAVPSLTGAWTIDRLFP